MQARRFCSTLLPGVVAGLLVLGACAPASTPAAPTAAPAAQSTQGATTGPAAQPTSAAAAKPAGTQAAPAATSAPATSLTKATLYLDWAINGYHAPYFIAREKGWYKDAGLDLDIQPGKGSGDTVKVVGAGQAQFGTPDGATAVKAISEGVPITMVASIFQETPMVIISMPDKPIKQPKELEGKSLGIVPEAAESKMLPAFAKRNNVDMSKVNVVTYTFATRIPSFLTGKVDAMNGYANADLVDAQDGAKGKQFQVMKYADFGISIYSNGLAVNNDFLKQHPDLVKGFVQASLNGWKYTFDHPDEALQVTKKYTELSMSNLKDQLDVSIPLINTPDAQKDGLGSMKAQKWDETQNLMIEYGDQKTKVPLDKVYTDQFVK